YADEPLFDKLGGALWFGGIVILLIAPAGLLARALPGVLPGQGLLRFLFFATPILWLLFPVCLLSSLSSVNRLAILRPKIVGRLMGISPQTAGFSLISAGMLAVGVGAWYMALLGSWWLVPVASAVGASVFLIHARLVGRLAWKIGLSAPVDRPRQEEEERP